MSLSAGTRLGPYDILAPLGAGGMGEVYRATDTKLKRQVAVKILPPVLAADPDRLARFQREAEVLASLNHPHIAAIYGLEDTPATDAGPAGMKALVMELVEGPTLADRIAEGPIPIAEALPIATQIAAALEAAHGQGIIHRDLKPANIKVRDDGTVKVLDFGLAKLAETGRAGQDDPSQSPTLTSPAAMTQMGVILGTAAYMSPEQARGRAVDKRTDVWAFGAVLYEMLTGRRAFDGEDVTEMMAAVVKDAPNWTALPADVPPHVVTLIQRCLEKDRNARIGDIAVARFLLAGHATGSASPVVAAPARSAAAGWRQTLPWVIAGAVIGTLAGWVIPRGAGSAPPVTHLQMNVVPADQLVGSIASVRPARTAMALSPDGRLAVFAATRGNVSQLYARALDQPSATPIPGTEGGFGPFFSPDGAWIGFWADDKIKKVPTAGGSPATIADAPAGGAWGASWAEDGTIYLAGRAGIVKVSPAGGTPATVTTPDASKGERDLLPHALPASALLFTTVPSRDWDKSNVVLLSLDTGERRVLIPGGTDARYVSTGHVVYMKRGTLMAVPFDLRSRQLSGTPVTLIEGVMHAVNAPSGADETGAGQFTVSASGSLLYLPGGISPSLESSWKWVDRSGTAHPLTAAPPGPYLFPRLSPDGQKIAVNVRRVASRTSDLWVYDVLRGAPTRLTFEGVNSWPLWSPDGKRLVYGGSTGGVANLYTINADGSGKPERLATSDQPQIPSSWAATTNVLAFLQRPREGVTGIWILPMGDPEPGGPQEGLAERQPRLLIESRFNLTHPEFSPDGRWLAYVSNESGAPEVYVQPFPGPGEKIRISTAGGSEPIWSANGRELLFRLPGQVFSAAISSVSPFRADTPRLVFETRPGEYDSTSPIRSWNAGADGKRFLMARFESNDKPITTMHVVLNWTEQLKRLAPAK
jgi:eukaryotic-like serine/threonine-protein kinase